MSIILTPFAKLLLLFYNITGSYGVSIILFGLVVRLVLSPIFLKGRKGMLAMSGLAEKQKVLAQKYARDREKYSQELTKLYEQEGVKPSSGCLWSFLPLPFLMVLYAIIRQPLTYLMNVTEDQFNVISNLLYGEVLNYKNQQLQIAQDVFLNHDKIVAAVPDLAGMPQIDFTFLGVNLSQTPSFMFWKADNVGSAFVLWLIPIISALLGVVSVADRAVITSGAYERNFTDENGRVYHHIIDLSTGTPADSSLCSVTVISADGTLADGLSTACYIMGLDKSLEYWKRDGENFDLILMTAENEVYVTAPIASSFTSDYTVHIVQ